MGCGEFIVKYVLFFANLFFALAGLTLLGLGAAVQWQVSPVLDVFDANLSVAPVTTMVVGGVVFLIAFFGCCGSIRESNCMLVTYAMSMIVLMLAKVSLAVIIFVNLESFTKEIPTWLNKVFNQSSMDTFQTIENTYKCCGTTGAISYPLLQIPDSCCANSPCNLINAYPGCNDVITEFFNTFGLVVGILAIGVAAIELVAVVFSLCLANHAKNRSRRSRY